MNQRFFIHKITVYHLNEDNTYTRTYIKNVNFRKHEGIKVNKGTENASSGTIIIPTEKTINISKKDIIVEGLIKDVLNETNRVKSLQEKYKIYTVVSIDDNRKGNLKHWKVGVN